MGLRPAPVPGVDPLFTEKDAEEILAYLEWQDSLCPGCGHPKHESFDPANEYAYRGLALNCHACGAKRRAERKASDDPAVYSVAVKSD